MLHPVRCDARELRESESFEVYERRRDATSGQNRLFRIRKCKADLWATARGEWFLENDCKWICTCHKVKKKGGTPIVLCKARTGMRNRGRAAGHLHDSIHPPAVPDSQTFPSSTNHQEIPFTDPRTLRQALHMHCGHSTMLLNSVGKILNSDQAARAIRSRYAAFFPLTVSHAFFKGAMIRNAHVYTAPDHDSRAVADLMMITHEPTGLTIIGLAFKVCRSVHCTK